MTIGLFNQLSGINALLYYSNSIFASAGFSSSSAALQTVGVGLVNLVATFVGMSLIDKLGRKTLMLIGSVGTAMSLAGVAWVFSTDTHKGLLVWFFMLFIGFFAIVAGGGDLGVYRGGVSVAGAVEGTECGVVVALDYECGDCGGVSVRGGEEPCAAVCVFCGDDGGAVFCGAVCVSGDEGADAGGDPGGVWDWVVLGCQLLVVSC